MAHKNDKTARGNSSQFFVAGELCRRGLVAVVTMGNTANTDILCSNVDGTQFVHIQVKTFKPGNATVSVGRKAEIAYGDNFFWVLGGIQPPESEEPNVFYVLPSSVIAQNVAENYQIWLDTPGVKGQAHNPTTVRTIQLPPRIEANGFSLEPYKNAWELIEEKLL